MRVIGVRTRLLFNSASLWLFMCNENQVVSPGRDFHTPFFASTDQLVYLPAAEATHYYPHHFPIHLYCLSGRR